MLPRHETINISKTDKISDVLLNDRMRAIQKAYLEGEEIIASQRLKDEIKQISKRLCRNEIISDINKYKELWQISAEINDKQKFEEKVENSVKELKQKYGVEGERLFEMLILKAIANPKLDKGFVNSKLFIRVSKLLYKKAKENLMNYNFPYSKLSSFEVFFYE